MYMEDKDLEKTKPIKILKDLSDNKLKETATRESKYKDAVIKEENKIKEEEAEEALAEKNIAMAEEILDKEKKTKEIEKEIDEEIEKTVSKKSKDKKKDKEKAGGVVALKNKWEALNKKQQRIILILGGVLLFLLLILIILLVFKLTSKPEPEKPVELPKEEVVPVVVDNFYYKEGNLYFLNDEETEIGSYECTNKDDSLCYVGLNANRDKFDITKLVDENGKEKDQRLPIINDNYVFVYDNKNEKATELVLYSISENKEFGRFLEIKSFENGYIIAKNTDGKYGLIKIDATKGVVEVLKFQYQYLGMIEGQKNLIAQTKDGYFVINSKGKELSEAISSSYTIKNYNDNYVVVYAGKEYSVLDYEGNMIDGGYEFATVYNKYALFVDSKRVYVRDKDKNKYTETGIKLNSTSYIKTYVYDTNDTLVETKRSFDVVEKDGELEFTIWVDGSKDATYERLSIAEATVNKNYAYINYFAGKLYFYKDTEKNDLIGFYTCANENIVDAKSTKYSSCIIATDTIFSDNDMIDAGGLYRVSAVPIINDRYAFIFDGNNNTVLFDIVEKVSKVSYLKVDSNTLSNDGKITKFSGDLDVIVQTKKNKYGMITITKDDVNVTHKFEYGKLEFLGDYVLGLDSSNNWRILFGNTETMGYDSKIRGYNPTKKFFKVMKDSKYYVYNESATKVSEDSYAYVELYSDFYAALDSERNLSVYGYNGQKLVDNTVKVGNYALYGNTNPAFKVKRDGDSFDVSVWNGSQYDVVTLANEVEEPVGGQS